MDKEKALKKLEKEMEHDPTLPFPESRQVFGEGDANATIMFIGEAPGAKENETGKPFVGRSGMLLDKLFADIGWKRSDVYITSIVKRRPPNNRDPLPDEIAVSLPYLARQIEIINPKVIATLGRFAMNYFLPDAKITRDHGKLFEQNNRKVFPLFHPAAALRSTKVMVELKKDFKKLAKL